MTPPVDFASYNNATAPLARNGLAFDWLRCDAHRRTLYEKLNGADGKLDIPSCAKPPTPASIDQPTMVLVTRRDLIEHVLLNPRRTFSNSPYAVLGSGDFMLGLDPWRAAAMRQAQADALDMRRVFPGPKQIDKLCWHAIDEAQVMALASPDFDLAKLAWATGLRFCAALFGYRLVDYPVLDESLTDAYRALTYQILGRHFVTDPLILLQGNEALGSLLTLTDELLDLYRRHPYRCPDGVGTMFKIDGFEPVLRKLALSPGTLNGAQLCMVVIGAMVGTVGNIQAATCTAVHHLLSNKGLDSARDAGDEQLWDVITRALRTNPPAAFLPRYCCADDDETGIRAGQEVVLALGGADTPDGTNRGDKLIFGLDVPGPTGRGMHACLGRFLAKPLVTALVRHVIGLPGLANAIDPSNGKPREITKTWGFRCEQYPLSYRRSAVRKQQTLNVAMPIKPPISVNAMKLRELIAAAAPRVDQVLREARHVHFAWFEFSENDTYLVLHTVYDGDFDAYIQYFALRVGELFDVLFDYIDGAPPRPIRQFPAEFIALIAVFDRPPGANYLFSAYPGSETPTIVQDEAQRRSVLARAACRSWP